MHEQTDKQTYACDPPLGGQSKQESKHTSALNSLNVPLPKYVFYRAFLGFIAFLAGAGAGAAGFFAIFIAIATFMAGGIVKTEKGNGRYCGMPRTSLRLHRSTDNA